VRSLDALLIVVGLVVVASLGYPALLFAVPLIAAAYFTGRNAR
jgi:hypothetical protein